jgi:putative DNA methylase
VTCPCCGYTIPRSRIETIAKSVGLGERLLAVVSTTEGKTGRSYRASTPADEDCVLQATGALSDLPSDLFGSLSTRPDELLPYLRSIFNVHVYGVTKWAQLFNDRQLLTAITVASLVRDTYTDALAVRG